MADDTLEDETKGPPQANHYYVIPLRYPRFMHWFFSTPLLRFEYRDKDWNKVNPLDLRCSKGSDYVVLERATKDLEGKEIPWAVPETELMGGMARSLVDDSPIQPFIAVDDKVEVRPLSFDPFVTCGVILIFEITKEIHGMKKQLVATHDPEIKNDA